MNTDIEILLDKTAEYLLKYDASEDGKKCAHTIQNYYEYRPNFILGCLDYARKFAYKAQTIDIDEDPNEFISVANEAYYAWASTMKSQNESIKKNKFRITESKLKQIVSESVKKVLKENMTSAFFYMVEKTVNDTAHAFTLCQGTDEEAIDLAEGLIKDLNAMLHFERSKNKLPNY